MKQIDEMIVMAYADAELPAEEALEVKRAIATDANLRVRVDSYRRSSELIREAYGAIAKEPCPASVLAAIGSVPNPVEGGVVRKPWPQRRWLPLAASIAAAAGIAAGFLTLRGLNPIDRETIIAMEPGERSVPGPGGPGLTESSEKRN